MSSLTIRKLVLSLILTFGSLFALPSYAWPEVDHMNMCGSAVKTARAYGGEFKGWQSHDKFTNAKSRSGAYYRANCKSTAAPTKKFVKRKVRKARKVRKSSKRNGYVKKCRYVKRCTTVRAKSKRVKRIKKRKKAKKYPYIAKSSRARSSKRAKYDKHADCVQVDRMNGSGPAVRVVHRH